MPSLRAERLTFSWDDAEPILDGADLQLGPGWTALVGTNGAGKTTLLRLLAGELAPQAGVVRREPPWAKVVTCPQSVETPSPAIAALARDAGGPARALRGRLALAPEGLDRWPTCSPGERRRWQVAAALHAEPAVLLLDEPTNHLDAAGRALLVPALRAYRGVGLLVSHDRALLDALCARTVRLAHGALRAWPLPYAEARDAWEAEAAAAWSERGAALEEARRAERLLADARRTRAATQAGRSGRGRDPKDRDARAMCAKTVAAWAEARAGRTVTVRREAARAARAAVPAPPPSPPPGRAIDLDWARCPRPVLLSLEAPTLRAGPRELLRDVRVRLGRADRIRLEGPNGAGKSTLLAALAAGSTLPPERLLVLPQELDAAEGAALLGQARALAPGPRGRALELLAALGVDPGRLLASRAPSPGEARQLAMALAIGRQAWGLVLDEPTNHLDLPAVERLEAAVAAWPGALLLVTHDDQLAAACTTGTWRIEAGRLEIR